MLLKFSLLPKSRGNVDLNTQCPCCVFESDLNRLVMQDMVADDWQMKEPLNGGTEPACLSNVLDTNWTLQIIKHFTNRREKFTRNFSEHGETLFCRYGTVPVNNQFTHWSYLLPTWIPLPVPCEYLKQRTTVPTHVGTHAMHDTRIIYISLSASD